MTAKIIVKGIIFDREHKKYCWYSGAMTTLPSEYMGECGGDVEPGYSPPADFFLVFDKIMLENPRTNLVKTGSK